MDISDEILFGRIDDMISVSAVRNKPQYMGFLDERQQYIVKNYIKYFDYDFNFFGGYSGAERCFASINAANQPLIYPIVAVEFSFRKADKLTHRDFLGSLMALGIKRESVGDILVDEGRAIVFVDENISAYILNQTNKIGKVGVKTKIVTEFNLPENDETQAISGTISSPRLDCYVNLITRLSREKSKELIMSKTVTLNYEICQNQSKAVSENDRISIRGYGKFTVDKIGSLTKKGRYHTTVLKHI